MTPNLTDPEENPYSPQIVASAHRVGDAREWHTEMEEIREKKELMGTETHRTRRLQQNEERRMGEHCPC